MKIQTTNNTFHKQYTLNKHSYILSTVPIKKLSKIQF